MKLKATLLNTFKREILLLYCNKSAVLGGGGHFQGINPKKYIFKFQMDFQSDKIGINEIPVAVE